MQDQERRLRHATTPRYHRHLKPRPVSRATWLRIAAWDRAFSAEEGLLRHGGSESIEDADAQDVRELMIELHFLIDLFESKQNGAQLTIVKTAMPFPDIKSHLNQRFRHRKK